MTDPREKDQIEATRGIVRRVDLQGLRRADRILAEAEQKRVQTEKETEEQRDTLLREAQARAVREATQTAAKVIAGAEDEARRKLQELEPQLARLVADTVRAIIGEMDTDEVRYRAALNALRAMREHRHGRIYANSSTAEPLRRAIADLPPGSAEVEGIVLDDTMADGEAVLTSDRGHTAIGIAALTDAALKAWDPEGTE